MVSKKTKTTIKSKVEEQASKEAKLFLQDVERVRKLLVRKKAEDLIPMIIMGLEDKKAITQLPMPLGAKK